MKISEVIHNSNNCSSSKEVNTTAIDNSSSKISDQQIDYYLDYYKDIYPMSFRAWHAKWIKEHGAELWVRYARTAQQEGKSPQRYFVWLLGRVREN